MEIEDKSLKHNKKKRKITRNPGVPSLPRVPGNP